MRRRKKVRRVKYRWKIKYRIRLIAFLLCLILGAVCIHAAFQAITNRNVQAFSDMKLTDGTVTLLDTYGTSFNIEASFKDTNKVDDVSLILKDLYTGKESSETSLSYTQKGNTVCVYEDNALAGLNLESVGTGEYAVLLKVDDGQKGDCKYITLLDGCDEKDIDYWTITKNGTNNEITTSFTSYSGTKYLRLNCKKGDKPSDVADFVIDAGHGGMDTGTSSLDGSVDEADVTLRYAKALKKILKNAGYTVVLSRDGTEDPEENTAYTIYDKGGRIEKMMEAQGKIALSLHCDSVYDSSTNGVQVYVSHVSDAVLGEQLADTIVRSTNMDYSEVGGMTQRADGVYEYTLSEEDIANVASASTAITTNTDYYFIIRETGGIVTGAFEDGSNTNYSANAYRNTNAGLETVLVELGFLSSTHDLKILENKKDLYVQAMADALISYTNSLKSK
jgi:N-acetylmuramoyl-L-alanine amidase